MHPPRASRPRLRPGPLRGITGTLVGLLAAWFCAPASAQVEHGGRPASLTHAPRRAVPTRRLPPVDVQRLRAEDAARAPGAPLRFAEVLELDLGLEDGGTWEELENGARLWRLRVESPGARSLALVFSRYRLVPGAELFVYDDQHSTVRGAYTDLENRLDGEFAVRPTRGEALTLEYYEPAAVRGQGELRLALVVHDYIDVLAVTDRTGGPGISGPCNVDVACPAGAGRQDQIDSVAWVLALPAGLCCSGSLVSNTSGDGTLLFLSARHCGDLSNAVFTFNYQKPSCGAGTAPLSDAVVGATELVADEDLDFRLVRLDGPPAFGMHLSGWDRSDVAPPSTYGIHHPSGDAKKISVDDDPPLKSGTRWQVKWNLGVTEGGSSGSPLFDAAGRFIGQLSQGSSSCLFPLGDDFYGRLAPQWELLAPYLDPGDTGALSVNGMDPATHVGGPFQVLAVAPASILPLSPGTRRDVRILGDGFSDTTTVALDGAPLPVGSYGRGGNTFLNLDLPPLDIGAHVFTVSEGGSSATIGFNVSAPGGPAYQLAGGDRGDVIVSFNGVDLVYSGVPGHRHYCFWSVSNVPSVHPFLSLGLGNQFTQIVACQVVTIPASGWVRLHQPVGPNLVPPGTLIYSQTACLSHGLPAPASNLQVVQFLF